MFQPSLTFRIQLFFVLCFGGDGTFGARPVWLTLGEQVWGLEIDAGVEWFRLCVSQPVVRSIARFHAAEEVQTRARWVELKPNHPGYKGASSISFAAKRQWVTELKVVSVARFAGKAALSFS